MSVYVRDGRPRGRSPVTVVIEIKTTRLWVSVLAWRDSGRRGKILDKPVTLVPLQVKTWEWIESRGDGWSEMTMRSGSEEVKCLFPVFMAAG